MKPSTFRSGAGAPAAPQGFTMLELVISVGMLALLIGGVFLLATTNIGLGNEVVKKQAEVSEQSAFLELLGNQFSSMPGNARLELESEDSGAQYLSDLTIQNVPMTFNWGGMDRVAKAVQLSTVRRRDGFLDIVLRYFEEPILEETEEIGETTNRFGDNEPFAEVVLMEDVYIFEWRVLDGRTMEWSYDWDLVGRLPLQMELLFAKDQLDAETPIRHVFWITPKQNPEVMMRQLQQGGQGGNQPGGAGDGATPGGETGGSTGNPPTVTIPGGAVTPVPGGSRGGGR
ncbi:hypothetical protein [Haloferula sp. A504]|uniref:hypothetical protein n=1 Tax=Haloferula sp. A504 TaxID=3373601 RepID=UPI0031C195E6|nr:type II secretion system GspH family protein [Verrucomicrobiaceae bacterium E54]